MPSANVAQLIHQLPGVNYATEDPGGFHSGDLRIHVFDYNDKAKHVLAARGFVEEGKLRADFYREGVYHDIVILSIFRDSEGGK